jgi:colanic acid biosynthesis protein WcaH
MAQVLSAETFLAVVANTPLVSIDLIIRNPQAAILMGRRLNEPAKGVWFVPGGRICKGETIEAAFSRISLNELGQSFTIDGASLLGAFTHLYDTNGLGVPGVSTHYVVLAYDLGAHRQFIEARAQHSETRWITEAESRAAGSEVHPNVLPYFRRNQAATSADAVTGT